MTMNEDKKKRSSCNALCTKTATTAPPPPHHCADEILGELSSYAAGLYAAGATYAGC